MKETDSASTRLDAALKRLEVALDAHLTRAGDPAALRSEIAALAADRSRLAEELDETLARERELQELADVASEALGAAILEVRAALDPEGKEPGGDGQG